MAQGLKTKLPKNSKAGKPTARETKKAKKTADELMLEAWKYTYKTRHKRLLKP